MHIHKQINILLITCKQYTIQNILAIWNHGWSSMMMTKSAIVPCLAGISSLFINSITLSNISA